MMFWIIVLAIIFIVSIVLAIKERDWLDFFCRTYD